MPAASLVLPGRTFALRIRELAMPLFCPKTTLWEMFPGLRSSLREAVAYKFGPAMAPAIGYNEIEEQNV
jgi:hypothetical protein